MISVVKVREFDSGSESYREKRWNERQILLLDSFHWERSWSREIAVEINHRQWRLRGKNAAFSDDLRIVLAWTGAACDFGSSTRPSTTTPAKSATGMM